MRVTLLWLTWVAALVPVQSLAQDLVEVQSEDDGLANSTQAARDDKPAQSLISIVRVENDSTGQWTPRLLAAAETAVQNDPRFRWLSPPKISLDETRVLLGCETWDPNCLAALGKTIAARQVLYVEVVRPVAYAPLLTVLLVDVEQPEQSWPIRVQLSDNSETGLMATEFFVRDAIGTAKTCLVLTSSAADSDAEIAVSVRSQCVGAKVFVDDSLVGTAPCRLDTRPELGEHRFRIEHDAFGSFKPQTIAVNREAFVVAFAPETVAPALAAVSSTQQTGQSDLAAPASTTEPATPVQAEPKDEVSWLAPIATAILSGGGIAFLSATVLYAMHYSTSERLASAAAALSSQGAVEDLSQAEYRDLAAQDRLLQVSALVSVIGAGVLSVAGASVFVWSSSLE